MGVYLVTFKLKEERADYDSVLAAFTARLEAYQYIHDEDFGSVYLISTPLAAGQINADLHRGLDHDDRIIVAQVLEGTYCGWLPKVMWAWVEERVRGQEGDVAPVPAPSPPSPPSPPSLPAEPE